MRQVFGEEILMKRSSLRTQIAMMVDAQIKLQNGDPDSITLDQLEGIRKIIADEVDGLVFF
jgi:hypothetical protein